MFGQDGDFSWELFEKSYNADLANNLGNLVNRVTSMAHRYRGGVLTGRGVGAGSLGAVGDEAARAIATAMDELDARRAAPRRRCASWTRPTSYRPTRAVEAGEGGRRRARSTRVLWDATEALRVAAVLLSPFMPSSSDEILRRLGVDHDIRDAALDRRRRVAGRRAAHRSAGHVCSGRGSKPRRPTPPPPTFRPRRRRVTDQPNPTAPVTPPASAPARSRARRRRVAVAARHTGSRSTTS